MWSLTHVSYILQPEGVYQSYSQMTSCILPPPLPYDDVCGLTRHPRTLLYSIPAIDIALPAVRNIDGAGRVNDLPLYTGETLSCNSSDAARRIHTVRIYMYSTSFYAVVIYSATWTRYIRNYYPRDTAQAKLYKSGDGVGYKE